MILEHVIAMSWPSRTEAEETESPRAADGVASSAGITATVRKSDHVFRKLNTLALFSVPLLLVTQMRLEALEHLFFYVFDVGEPVPTSDIAVFTGALKLQNEFFH